jgi:hypothetical protein
MQSTGNLKEKLSPKSHGCRSRTQCDLLFFSDPWALKPQAQQNHAASKKKNELRLDPTNKQNEEVGNHGPL